MIQLQVKGDNCANKLTSVHTFGTVYMMSVQTQQSCTCLLLLGQLSIQNTRVHFIQCRSSPPTAFSAYTYSKLTLSRAISYFKLKFSEQLLVHVLLYIIFYFYASQRKVSSNIMYSVSQLKRWSGVWWLVNPFISHFWKGYTRPLMIYTGTSTPFTIMDFCRKEQVFYRYMWRLIGGASFRQWHGISVCEQLCRTGGIQAQQRHFQQAVCKGLKPVCSKMSVDSQLIESCFCPPKKNFPAIFSRNPPPMRTENRLIVENLSSRVSWQVLSLLFIYLFFA